MDNDSERLIGANGGSYGSRVHQATGIVSVQADCATGVALNLLVEYAVQHNRTVVDIATDVIERRVRFDKK